MRWIVVVARLVAGSALAQVPDEAEACLERLRDGSIDRAERAALRARLASVLPRDEAWPRLNDFLTEDALHDDLPRLAAFVRDHREYAFGSGALVYRREGNGYVFYRFGEDQDDDGGLAVERSADGDVPFRSERP